MKLLSFLKRVCGIMWLSLVLIPMANAQQQTITYAQPVGQQQQGYGTPAQTFPKLPPSAPCTAAILPGVWKLSRVYEAPPGDEITAFLVNPAEYILFNTDNTYGKYNAGRAELPPGSIRNEIAKHTSGLQQYLVDTVGFLYFYQDKVPIDTQACFIVASTLEQFSPGQMLLMPPQGQFEGRLLRVYGRVNEQPSGHPPMQPIRH